MLQVIVKLIGMLIVLLGIVFIYDARILTKKFFGFGDQNEATGGLKILGFIIAMIGGAIVYFV
ncbi:MAG: hypothetical protein HFJ33_04920 [Clostridia bacterium]|nr:hypothetical protein [Clostridia bacterium]